jgi:hypothetical protein
MDVNATTSRIDPPVVTTPAPPARAPRPEIPAEGPAPPAGDPAPGTDLKFTLRSADVVAKFSIHEATRSVMVTIFDRKTGEVIREIPSHRYLDLVAALQGKGTLLDTSR